MFGVASELQLDTKVEDADGPMVTDSSRDGPSPLPHLAGCSGLQNGTSLGEPAGPVLSGPLSMESSDIKLDMTGDTLPGNSGSPVHLADNCTGNGIQHFI